MIPLVCTHTHTHTHAHTAETVKPKQAKTPPPNTRLRPRALRHGSVEEPPGLEKANNLRVYDKYELIEYNAAAAAATTTSTSTGALADPGADTSRPTLSPSLSLPLFLSLFPLANKGKRAGKQAGVNCEEGVRGTFFLVGSSKVHRGKNASATRSSWGKRGSRRNISRRSHPSGASRHHWCKDEKKAPCARALHDTAEGAPRNEGVCICLSPTGRKTQDGFR